MKNLQSSVVIGIMCFLLSFGIAVQIASIKNESTVIAVENTEKKLRDEVLQIINDYNRTYSKLQKSEKKLEKLRNKVSETNEITKNWSDELERVNKYLGLTNLKGHGVIIKIENADLMHIINALNNAGAEAISINGNRITFYSEIESDGDIVTLDDTILEEPMEIKAIGADRLLAAITMKGSYLDDLKTRGHKFTIETSEDIIINKYNGIYNLNFLENIK
ncbi:MAG: DUF881 domain-containing protein [Clostridia bacterium]|nr:DUF881 domain-containing protein [Clostridia bacterium]